MSPLLAALGAPVALGAAAWLPFARALRRGRRVTAALVVGAWALALAGLLPAIETMRPGTCAALFPGAGAYGETMLAWARSGQGCESSPVCFLPRHALQAVAFAAATWASGGLLGLMLAAVLFGWMGAYTGGLAAASGRGAVAAALGWHPWAVVRVVAFVALGVALAEPLARRGLPPLPGRRRWLLAGLLGLALDVTLKALLAGVWWRVAIAPLLR